MRATIHEAKTNLSEPLEAVAAGAEVVIARGKVPIARLVPSRQRRFEIGSRDGTLSGPLPDLPEPTSEDEPTAREGGA